ncbi:MAG TPA: hypothetical protein VH720_02410 [Candidatus Limnocylindrales bacterium]
MPERAGRSARRPGAILPVGKRAAAPDPVADSTGGSELWLCPRCGHRFVSANLWHSCSRFTLDEAFARSTPEARSGFERFVALIERCGPVVVIPQKTRIVLMARVRFAGCKVRRDHVLATIALTRRVDHPRWTQVEEVAPGWIAHRFPIRGPEDLDDPELHPLLCEGYRQHGEQRKLVGRRR